MKAEIIAIGTEILLGQIVNTNAQYMANELADLGIDVYFQGVVGDNKSRIKEALSIARNRSDFILCCGGLGPTEDDITKDAIAEFTHTRLIIDKDAETKIVELFKDDNDTLITANKRQANTIEGSHLLSNEVGLAVGFVHKHCYQGKQTYYAVIPGPPREMKVMFERELKPFLDELLGERKKIYSKYLKFGNIGESSVENKLKDLIANQDKVSIAPYANIGEVTIRLTVKADSAEQAENDFLDTINRIKDLLGGYLYSENNETLEQVFNKHDIEDFGVFEANTNAYLTHRLLSTDVHYNNIKTSSATTMDEIINEKLAESVFLDFITKNSLKNAIGVFHCLSTASAKTPSGRPSKKFYIGLYINNKLEIAERWFIGDMQAVQIRAAKTAIFKFLKGK